MGNLHLAELIEQGRPALLDRYGQRLTSHQRAALDAMAACRTGALGATVMACTDCDQRQIRLRSCGHRSCPRCQHHAAADWLARQQAKLVPTPYFMVTFTLPTTLRPLAYRHPQAIYDLLFRTAIGTLRTFSRAIPTSRRISPPPRFCTPTPGGSTTTPTCTSSCRARGSTGCDAGVR